MENEIDESLIMNMPIEKTLGQGFISNDYMLIIKLFLYEIFATIVTWTITNVVRSIYRSYFQMPYDDHEHNNAEQYASSSAHSARIIENPDGPCIRISVSGSVCMDNDDEQSQKSSETSTRDSEFSTEDGETWDKVGCSLFSIDTESSKFSDLNESTNSSEVVKAIIDFEECSEKLPEFPTAETNETEKNGNANERKRNRCTEESGTSTDDICLNAVNLSKIKESLNLTKEEDEKSMKDLETKLKQLKIDEAPKKIKKVDEDGDVKCISSRSLKSDFQNELGINLKKIEILSTIEYKDGCKLEELKEQFSSPI